MNNALEHLLFYPAQGFSCRSGVAFCQCAKEPVIVNIRRGTGIR